MGKSKIMSCFTGIYDRLFLHRNWRIAYFIYLLFFSLDIRHWMELNRQLRKSMEEYHKDLLSEKPWRFWRRDFFYSFFFLGADLEVDYYGSLMIGKSWPHKKKIVTDHKNMFATKYLNSPKTRSLCWDKTQSAEMWADWYKRRWCGSSADVPVTAEKLKWIANEKESVIVKPLASSGGEGILAYDVSTDEKLQAAVEKINLSGEDSIIEERIIQTGLLHDLNPDSVNTCRVITCRHADGEIELVCTYLRLGGAGSVMDNFSSGGVQYVVEKETGILGMGSDGYGRKYTVHPASGKTVTGIKIPNWQDAVEFCFSAHRHAPEGLVIIGWDLCISDDGMSLVEVNSRACYCQLFKESEDHWGAIKNLLDEADRERKKRSKSK